ncbi:dihydrodipicolinate synthase family protein [Actinomyces sp. HMSC075B09]|uniref:dihydrodipicolinate synthase family protein n=1 Tax=Actinomyces sp. HMSC075B09 TaxID=1739358 RepID=UPI0008A2BDAB|nr:dihydrodipicolinate synthase family protein [Actinomyces sp. HMSC075B09]OFJ62661.1 dihydrodipicolinate synthase family protein [Actinomyces sp. HMSC075B09]
MNKKICGVVPPVVTPLLPTGEVDVVSYENHLNRMIDAGVNGIFVLGSSSEVVFLTDRQRRQVLEIANRVVAGRVPILAGVIETQTQRVIDQIRMVEEIGADGVVATAPFYALAGMAEVENHFRLLHEATSLPIFAYDIPVCVHVKLPTELLLKLGKEGVIAGVKDSSGDDVSFRYLVAGNKALGKPMSILTGHEVVVDGAYLSGADGSVPGLANVDPHAYVREWKAYEAGDWNAVREEQERLAELMRIAQVSKGVVGYGAGVGSFKTALWLMGVFSSNAITPPVKALEGENVTAIKDILVKAGLLNE